PSAKIVSNASDDLPDPDSPVKTTMLLRGKSRSTLFRLCSRAPRTTRRSDTRVAPSLAGYMQRQRSDLADLSHARRGHRQSPAGAVAALGQQPVRGPLDQHGE